MPFLSLPKAADAEAMRRLTSLSVDDTMLPKKQNSPTVSSSLPSKVMRFSDKVMTLHLEKLIFISHFLQAALGCPTEFHHM